MGVAEIELPFPRATNIHGTEFLPHARQAKNTGALVTHHNSLIGQGVSGRVKPKKTGGFVLDH